MARLKEIYKKEIVPALTKQFGYKSAMEVPRVSKVVLNMGVGEAPVFPSSSPGSPPTLNS